MANLNKFTINWFPLIYINEHTANIFNPNKGIIYSLLKLFAMFQLRLFHYKYYEEGDVVDILSIRCINCNKETGLYF